MEEVRVHIRYMIRRDMPEVLQIEDASFAWYAWTEEDFLRTLRQRNCIGMVAESGEKIVGYMVYDLHARKLQLLNFAVHPDWRRSGVGRCLIAKLVSKMSGHRRPYLVADVGEDNVAAHLFLRNVGFRAVSVNRGLYDGDDAYRFALCVDGVEWDAEAAEAKRRVYEGDKI